jgi:glutamate dehydrogenase
MLVKDELLDKVLARVKEQMPEDQAPQVEEFARQYYGWIDAEDLEDRSPIDVYGAAVSHWSFAGQRRPGERKIRVYNPQFDEHGWQSTHTVVEMVNDDMPFLVDSTRTEINRQGYSIHLMIHPVMKVRRDPEGRLLEVLPPDADDEDALPESVIHVEVDRQTELEVLEGLRRSSRTSRRPSRTGPGCARRSRPSSRASMRTRRPSSLRTSPRPAPFWSGSTRTTSLSSATATTT